MPKRIQRRRTKGWRMPRGAVYVGRPTKWGNPARLSDYPPSVPLPERRRRAVADFRVILRIHVFSNYPTPRKIRRELRGKDLVCWCPLDQPCHADVLMEIANANSA